jgi:hypothetical protein
MLDTITSAYFTALLDKTCWMETAGGDLPVTVADVWESPRAALPDACRKPFGVLFQGPQSPTLAEDGTVNLRVDGADGWRLEGAFVNRVMPPPGQGPGVYYQFVVNT